MSSSFIFLYNFLLFCVRPMIENLTYLIDNVKSFPVGIVSKVFLETDMLIFVAYGSNNICIQANWNNW